MSIPSSASVRCLCRTLPWGTAETDADSCVCGGTLQAFARVPLASLSSEQLTESVLALMASTVPLSEGVKAKEPAPAPFSTIPGPGKRAELAKIEATLAVNFGAGGAQRTRRLRLRPVTWALGEEDIFVLVRLCAELPSRAEGRIPCIANGCKRAGFFLLDTHPGEHANVLADLRPLLRRVRERIAGHVLAAGDGASLYRALMAVRAEVRLLCAQLFCWLGHGAAAPKAAELSAEFVVCFFYVPLFVTLVPDYAVRGRRGCTLALAALETIRGKPLDEDTICDLTKATDNTRRPVEFSVEPTACQTSYRRAPR